MSDHKDQRPGAAPGAVSDDHIPVLHDIVSPGDEDALPTLNPTDAVYIEAPMVLDDRPVYKPDLTELSDTLRASLGQQLDGAIDHAVYEQLQTTMEEVASNIKSRVRAQLEALLPELIEAALHRDKL